jgi:hypothetical protein
MYLDVRTLVVLAAFVSVVPTVVSALVWYKRPTYPGFGRWTLGNLFGTIAMLLLGLRGIAPDWITVVLANLSVVAAAILIFQGVRLFCGLRLYWWPEYLAGVLAILAVIYFRYATNNLDVRIFSMSLQIGSLGLANGITLLQAARVGRRFSMYFTGIIFALAGAIHLFRGIYVYAWAPSADLFAPSSASAAFFGIASLGVVCWSFGFILMTDDRLAADSKHQRWEPATVQVESLPNAEIGKPVTEAEVRQQGQRIVCSDGFRRSARMERFLTLAVERTLTGHPEELKEYALGRDVFNRGDQYDPREDSIVRVEAQRLRRKLREYYESCGKNDPIIVEFHAGSYVPAFRYARPIEAHLAMSNVSPRVTNG